MRILMLTSSSGLYGAERMILSLAEFLMQNKNFVYLVCLRSIFKSKPEIYLQAKKKNIPAYLLYCQNKLDMRIILKLKNFIKKEGIRIIHSHNYKSNLYGLIVSKISKVPIVATLHGWTKESLKIKLYEMLDKVVIRGMDCIVAVSSSINEKLKRMGLEKKTFFIPNGVDTERFNSLNCQADLRHFYGLNESDLVIGSVGRLTSEKGFIFLIKAFAKVHSKISNLKLLIIGDGPLREILEKEIAKLNLKEKIILAGYRKDIESFYPLMDIFVLPSLSEGLPLVLLEAMSVGLPVIATRVGGIPYVAGNGEAILVPPASIEELEKAILFLIKNPFLRKELGKKAKEKVTSQFSLKKCLEEYLKVYKSLAN